MSNNPFGLSKVKYVIAVSSCKGGVGKSTMAAAIARELHTQGFKVGLLDSDIHGPSVPSLFAITVKEVYTNEFKMITPVDHQGIKLMSFGFILGDAPAVMRGPIVARYIQQLLLQTDWGTLDYLIIDMPPGTGDIQLTITQTIKLTGAVIVTTRQTLSVVDVARGILMFEKVNVPILGIIENMAYFMCDQCSKKHYIFGESKAIGLSERFGVPTLAEMPIDANFTTSFVNYQSNALMSDLVKKLLHKVDLHVNANEKAPAVRFDQQSIFVTFDGQKEVAIENYLVRSSCQCALCIDELSGKQLLNPAKIRADIAPTEIVPLGNYAIGITWNDGHASGIYAYSLLKKLTTQ